ncbi:hypothetical protein LEP1GSC036_2925 [Leptospira weilii str. 2006001853]|uniref:Uncharacterized protein n=1 Tax=Leptospira weilii str. 2006001853 TaxID=1001589 RepID=A0A828Z3L1_9LEPT|nr:hypothetical protein LEP1GSC036_2925 [Leptospira weilii str. 2006001853]
MNSIFHFRESGFIRKMSVLYDKSPKKLVIRIFLVQARSLHLNFFGTEIFLNPISKIRI